MPALRSALNRQWEAPRQLGASPEAGGGGLPSCSVVYTDRAHCCTVRCSGWVGVTALVGMCWAYCTLKSTGVTGKF